MTGPLVLTLQAPTAFAVQAREHLRITHALDAAQNSKHVLSLRFRALSPEKCTTSFHQRMYEDVNACFGPDSKCNSLNVNVAVATNLLAAAQNGFLTGAAHQAIAQLRDASQRFESTEEWMVLIEMQVNALASLE